MALGITGSHSRAPILNASRCWAISGPFSQNVADMTQSLSTVGSILVSLTNVWGSHLSEVSTAYLQEEVVPPNQHDQMGFVSGLAPAGIGNSYDRGDSWAPQARYQMG